jgi:hypothetical protein
MTRNASPSRSLGIRPRSLLRWASAQQQNTQTWVSQTRQYLILSLREATRWRCEQQGALSPYCSWASGDRCSLLAAERRRCRWTHSWSPAGPPARGRATPGLERRGTPPWARAPSPGRSSPRAWPGRCGRRRPRT